MEYTMKYLSVKYEVKLVYYVLDRKCALQWLTQNDKK